MFTVTCDVHLRFVCLDEWVFCLFHLQFTFTCAIGSPAMCYTDRWVSFLVPFFRGVSGHVPVSHQTFLAAQPWHGPLVCTSEQACELDTGAETDSGVG